MPTGSRCVSTGSAAGLPVDAPNVPFPYREHPVISMASAARMPPPDCSTTASGAGETVGRWLPQDGVGSHYDNRVVTADETVWVEVR
jgi:hypothetical protein